MEHLSKFHGLKVEHWYEDDLEKQCIEFEGTVSAEQISETAYQLIPNLDELLNTRPVWEADYVGIRQLFILYYYSENQRSL
jgi:hypothetical protein